MEKYDSRVDAYIAKSAPFARPVLEYLRQTIHEASPLLTETMKWSMPFFDYKGPVCMMAAFKQHCSFRLWKSSLLSDPQKVLKEGDESLGSLGRITSIADLPSKEMLIDFINQMIALNEQGINVHSKKAPAERAELVIPDYFTEFLAGHPKAKEVFDGFSYSNKKEYAEWITEAKTDATRQKRMETAAEWLTEGKSRHWKYK